MKKEALVPVLAVLLAFAVPAGVSARAVLDAGLSVPLVPDASDPQELVPQTEVPPGLTQAGISGTLPLGSLETRKLDVGIDLLVEQVSTEPSAVENGVGLMLTFTGP